jgi:ATP-dependent exoDNAse (exonuclease V) beta subunit
MTSNALPPDQAARLQALDITQSFLVQAPAGSGKTDLLTRRFLALLATVDEPEEILAITFTRAATAEMRNRILSQIEKAQSDPQQIADENLRSLAVAALLHSKALDWKLLEQPQRLRIETIDSFCGSLARSTPLLVRLGGSLTPSENPAPLYSESVRRLFSLLGDESTPQRSELSNALSQILLHRDNSLRDVESLLCAMLKTRDQWLHPILSSAVNGEEWQLQIEHQQITMQDQILRTAVDLQSELVRIPGSEAQLLNALAISETYKALDKGLPIPPTPSAFPPLNAASADEIRELLASLSSLLLTSGNWRRQYTKAQGFPADVIEAKQTGKILLDLLKHLSAETGAQSILQSVASLPPSTFNKEQTELLRCCFVVLKRLYAELRVLFAERNEVDFTEISHAALQVLLHADGVEPSDLALALSDDLHHILVDEFQDTSRRQHELLRALMSNWSDDQSRTCFLVGDPMQSIYGFRQAEVELFGEIRDFGFLNEHALLLKPTSLRLLANFRSAPSLVHRLNEIFPTVFQNQSAASGVQFVPALPARKQTSDTINQAAPRLHLHPTFLDQDDRNIDCDKQTERIVELLESYHAQFAAAPSDEKQRIVVLGRTRNDLMPIADALQLRSIPYRGIEIVPLAERPEVLDLCSLLRALTNPADRIAWLSILRAPWCGLSIESLHTIANTTNSKFPTPYPLQQPLPVALRKGCSLLDAEEQVRLTLLLDCMEEALRLRYAQPELKLGSWLERLWHSLGGPLCVDQVGAANAALFFRMLDDFPNGELDATGSLFDESLRALWALPDPSVSAERGIQLMTIHKSKGLEFESVLLVGLERKPGTDESELVYWLERLAQNEDAVTSDTEFLVAPVAGKGEANDPLVQWVKGVRAERAAEEHKRLLYVAATRAREYLHLFFCLKVKDGEIKKPEPASLLATAWSALETETAPQFNLWKQYNEQSASQIIDAIAADAASNLLTMPLPTSPLITKRLRFSDLPASNISSDTEPQPTAELAQTPAFERRAGGLESRLIGISVHRLIELCTRALTHSSIDDARKVLSDSRQREELWFTAQGLDLQEASTQAMRAVRAVATMLDSEDGRWILSPHQQAQSEVRWTRPHRGTIRTFQPDRIFLAGNAPGTEGEDCWWIIDYKTSHPEGKDGPSQDAFLAEEAEEHSEQLKIYAETLEMLEGSARPIRTALYFPLIAKLYCL